jgi:DNA-binding transcriptional regulator YhcF (GntR family)
MLTGQIDSTFTTQQRDLFASGFVAEIGVNAYGVWSAIKFYADFKTGEAFPGMREIGRKVGLSKDTVNRAVEVLKKAHLLRVVDNSKFKRKGQTYIARERLAIRVGQQVVCVVVIDYVPENIRKRINKINNSLKLGENDPDVWAEVEIIPGAGFLWDDKSKSLKLKVLASDMPSNGIEEKDQYHQRLGEELLANIAPELTKKMKLKNIAPSRPLDGTTSHP